SRIINANTFGASAHKLAGSEYTLEEIIAAGIANCKRACAPTAHWPRWTWPTGRTAGAQRHAGF
ncbi:hypothetical protein LEA_09458, partial [human gut metagenome]